MPFPNIAVLLSYLDVLSAICYRSLACSGQFRFDKTQLLFTIVSPPKTNPKGDNT